MRWGLLGIAIAGCAPPRGELTIETVDAVAVDQVFTIRVYEPAGVEGLRPMLLLFDGDDWTGRTVGVVDALQDEGVIRTPIVVSVGYGDTPNARGRDLTVPGPGIPDDHGEIGPFFTFLEDELVPWVDARFDTDPTADARVLMGHSFGGLAATWGVFEARETFSNAIALSPSLVFGEGAMFGIEAAWASAHDDLPGRVYLGAGTLEDHSLADLTRTFGERLDARAYPGLDLRTALIPGLTHVDLFPAGAEAGLRHVLEAP